MKSLINKLLKQCIYGYKCDSLHYISHLKRKGISIGDGTIFYDPISNVIDETNPQLLRIGDNVFIGMNAIILKGSTIGSNVVIGAGSVVTCDCESESVYAGVPAKKIMSLEQYYKKKRNEQIYAVQTIVHSMQDEMERKAVLREYAPIFEDYRCHAVQKLISDTGYREVCNRFYEMYSRPFADYYELLKFTETSETPMFQKKD